MALKRGGQQTHGLSRTTEYHAWQTMRSRCTVPTNKAYPGYGGRGITVCDRWLNSVENFVADMGFKPSPKHELDREDNEKGYSPDNCRWVTRTINSRNRRSNRWVTYGGKRMVLAQALELSGLEADVVSKRLEAGWTELRALTEPARFMSAKGCGPKRAPMTNVTGFKGVQQDSGCSTYHFRRMINKKRICICGFKTPAAAYEAYLASAPKPSQEHDEQPASFTT